MYKHIKVDNTTHNPHSRNCHTQLRDARWRFITMRYPTDIAFSTVTLLTVYMQKQNYMTRTHLDTYKYKIYIYIYSNEYTTV